MALLVILCALLTAAALFFIFRPILVGGSSGLLDLEGATSNLKKLLRRKETVYENIKDLDFEYKMGKLSDEDYNRLRNDYSNEAYALMKDIEKIQPETLQKAGQPQVITVLKDPKKTRKSR